MTKVFLTFLYYLILSILVLIIGQLSPTNIAGPGFDLVVYILAPILCAVLLAKSIKAKNIKARRSGRGFGKLLIWVNLLGALAVMIILVYVVTKKNYLGLQ